MDKLLKVGSGIADKTFIYQKERLEEELKISNLEINEDTLFQYILFKLAEKVEDEDEEVINISCSSSLHLFYFLSFHIG